MVYCFCLLPGPQIVRKIIVFRAVILGLRFFFYLPLGFRYTPPEKKLNSFSGGSFKCEPWEEDMNSWIEGLAYECTCSKLQPEGSIP